MNGTRMWQNTLIASSTVKMIVKNKSHWSIRIAKGVELPFASTKLLLFCASMIVQAKFCDTTMFGYGGLMCVETIQIAYPGN